MKSWNTINIKCFRGFLNICWSNVLFCSNTGYAEYEHSLLYCPCSSAELPRRKHTQLLKLPEQCCTTQHLAALQLPPRRRLCSCSEVSDTAEVMRTGRAGCTHAWKSAGRCRLVLQRTNFSSSILICRAALPQLLPKQQLEPAEVCRWKGKACGTHRVGACLGSPGARLHHPGHKVSQGEKAGRGQQWEQCPWHIPVVHPHGASPWQAQSVLLLGHGAGLPWLCRSTWWGIKFKECWEWRSACDLSGTSNIIFLPLRDGRLSCWGLPRHWMLKEVNHV